MLRALMGAPPRPARRPRRSGQPDRIRATGTRYRRPVEHRAPDPGPRAAWAFALVVLVLGLGAIVIVASGGTSGWTASAPTPTPTPPPTATPPVTLAPSPTDALAVTGGDPGRELTTVAPGRSPVARATPVTSLEPRADPGASALGVEFPQDGEVVVSRRINVFGRAPGGVRVLRELPDGTTATTVARPDGLWIMGVDLQPGTTELRFVVEGTTDAPVVVRVTYRPR